MAQVTKTVCDVFGTSKDLTSVGVTITTGPCDASGQQQLFADDAHVFERFQVEALSPRAIKRLERFIKRGLVSVAKWKERDDAK